MKISLRTLWQLADRAAEDLGQPTNVFIEAGTNYMGTPGYSRVERGGDLAPGRRYASGVRLMASDTVTLGDGVLSVADEVGMSIDFPGERPGVVGLYGNTEKAGQYRPQLETTIDWLVSKGRYRWGWFLPLSIGGLLLIALLLVGLVLSAIITASVGYAALTVPFLVITGIATTWGIGAGTIKLIRRDRRRCRGVVVSLRDRP